MPEMTTGEGSMPFFEALFTSISAISQTGLILVDTGSYYTFKGQIIIMLLIQVGALGIISFGTFFGAYIASGAGLKQRHSFLDFFLSDADFDTTKLFKMIFYYTLIIDIGGAIVLFFLWNPEIHFSSLGEKMFFSLFHSVSAFCNAGFSLFSQGTYTENLRHAYVFHTAIISLVFLGSLGYPTLYNIFGLRNIWDRRKKRWKRWDINSRISVYTSLGLILLGAVLFFILENNNTLANIETGGSIITSIFQSTTRTAGFNTVDISMVGTPMLIVLCFLMFVGGSSGSMCGGIRTSTFFVAILLLFRIMTGRRKVEVWKRELPFNILYKVFSIFVFAATFILLATFSLTITDPEIDAMDLVFEQISAFGTVGLSTGITSSLSYAGKIVIIVSMFFGRVGTLTLAFALSTQLKPVTYKYPSTNIWVG